MREIVGNIRSVILCKQESSWVSEITVQRWNIWKITYYTTSLVECELLNYEVFAWGLPAPVLLSKSLIRHSVTQTGLFSPVRLYHAAF